MPVSPREGRSPIRRRLAIAGAVVGALVAVWLAAWGIDSATSGGTTVRNLAVLGTAVGGLNDAELTGRLEQVAAGYDNTVVDISTPAEDLGSTAGTIGLTVDVDATAGAVRSAYDDVFVLARPAVWLASFVRPISIDAAVELDPDATDRPPLSTLLEANLTPAVEPSLVADGNVLVVVDGSDGEGIPADVLTSSIEAAAAATQGEAVSVTLDTQPVSPLVTPEQALETAVLASLTVAEPLTIEVGDRTTTVEADVMATWVVGRPTAEGMAFDIDPERVEASLNEVLGDLGSPEVPTAFTVAGDQVTFGGGQPGTECCDDTSTERIIAALGSPERVARLDLVPKPLERGPEWAESLQITVPVGTFTTFYPPGQSRVRNIEVIADKIRGAVIEPGATFSVNDFTGPRGLAEGYVEGGIILNGRPATGVGGGISQFATTLFNAAFFAGLDIPDYMMHTIYISRYPYGREATLAYGSVDLKIFNNTPYGVLIWPTYTPDSITVTLYSSPYAIGAETGQTRTPAGACTRVTTERTRLFIDGRTDVDSFVGLYQPAEGVLC